jgi:hypothetical protein
MMAKTFRQREIRPLMADQPKAVPATARNALTS